MPLLNDKTCKTCDQELKWIGSIMDGRLECTNPFCREKFDGMKLDCGSGNILAGDFEQDVAVKDSCNLDPNPPIIPAVSNKSLDERAMEDRYLVGVAKGHRGWCSSIFYLNGCQCGHRAGPANIPLKDVRDREIAYYGPLYKS